MSANADGQYDAASCPVSHIELNTVTELDVECIHQVTAHTHNLLTGLWILSGTMRVSGYQKKHSPIYTYHGHQFSLFCFIHLRRSMASSLFNPHA